MCTVWADSMWTPVEVCMVTLLHACEHTGETESSNLPFKAPYSAKAIHRQWLKQSPGQVLHIVRIQVAR